MGEYPQAGGLRPTARRICTCMTIAELFELTSANRVAQQLPNGFFQQACPLFTSRDSRQHERRGIDIEPDNEIDVVIRPAPSRTASTLVPSSSKLPPDSVASERIRLACKLPENARFRKS